MDVIEAVKTRKSVRDFEDRPIEDEKLESILEAARLAPSARNYQQWRFVVVKDRQTRAEIARAANDQSFVGEAPVVIAACASETEHVMPCGYPSHPIDVAIALDHLTLAAAEQGLGTCWIGAFDQQKIKKILGIPKEAGVVALMPVGYPGDASVKHKSRHSMGDIIMHERWRPE